MIYDLHDLVVVAPRQGDDHFADRVVRHRRDEVLKCSEALDAPQPALLRRVVVEVADDAVAQTRVGQNGADHRAAHLTGADHQHAIHADAAPPTRVDHDVLDQPGSCHEHHDQRGSQHQHTARVHQRLQEKRDRHHADNRRRGAAHDVVQVAQPAAVAHHRVQTVNAEDSQREYGQQNRKRDVRGERRVEAWIDRVGDLKLVPDDVRQHERHVDKEGIEGHPDTLCHLTVPCHVRCVPLWLKFKARR